MMSKEKADKKTDDDSADQFKISNAESFNKFITTLGSVYVPGLFYLIRHPIQDMNICLLRVSAWMFVIALIITLIGLYLGAQYPLRKSIIGLIIGHLDTVALFLFITSIIIVAAVFLN